ncbi:hypothetical protein PCCS19_55790 [Paenibacillus sp. CCS19]|uniref:phosphodiester glycosidase family protein n=1 Tax=Paenibacillus sp. CCS19 TaxID=3158387 RepID=UPI00256808BB|nr:phosphodiester glycosidase family protein [Paenibacillus cellulosilyticus]GMK42519.1 hypothetical protein PCCS19_55790 [Paenibacillus cellulosilyticus]
MADSMETQQEHSSSNNEAGTSGRKGRAAWVAAVVLIAAALSFGAAGIAIWLTAAQTDNHGTNGKPAYDGYTYVRQEAEGVVMHALVTEPSKVTLEAVRGNVAGTPYYGVNGGFFYNGMLLSMAIINDQPVGGKPQTYGSGYSNVKFARGTLVWDGATDQLSVQVVSNADELKVTDRAHYWAQGGISMRPLDDAGWRQQADAEQAPFPDDDRLRTAAAYDKDGKLYLIVSQTKTTLATFRQAIIEAYGEMEDGIFLDGDGSSQLRAFEATLPGDGRQVEQMIRLKNPGENR